MPKLDVHRGGLARRHRNAVDDDGRVADGRGADPVRTGRDARDRVATLRVGGDGELRAEEGDAHPLNRLVGLHTGNRTGDPARLTLRGGARGQLEERTGGQQADGDEPTLHGGQCSEAGGTY